MKHRLTAKQHEILVALTEDLTTSLVRTRREVRIGAPAGTRRMIYAPRQTIDALEGRGLIKLDRPWIWTTIGMTITDEGRAALGKV